MFEHLTNYKMNSYVARIEQCMPQGILVHVMPLFKKVSSINVFFYLPIHGKSLCSEIKCNEIHVLDDSMLCMQF